MIYRLIHFRTTSYFQSYIQIFYVCVFVPYFEVWCLLKNHIYFDLREKWCGPYQEASLICNPTLEEIRNVCLFFFATKNLQSLELHVKFIKMTQKESTLCDEEAIHSELRPSVTIKFSNKVYKKVKTKSRKNRHLDFSSKGNM